MDVGFIQDRSIRYQAATIGSVFAPLAVHLYRRKALS
jgi:hypothetical protein